MRSPNPRAPAYEFRNDQEFVGVANSIETDTSGGFRILSVTFDRVDWPDASAALTHQRNVTVKQLAADCFIEGACKVRELAILNGFFARAVSKIPKS